MTRHDPLAYLGPWSWSDTPILTHAFHWNPPRSLPVAGPGFAELEPLDFSDMGNGVELYRGPSLIDGAPIVVLANGIFDKSGNQKTGAMIQTFILRADVDPVRAIDLGLDSSICGDCPHRGKVLVSLRSPVFHHYMGRPRRVTVGNVGRTCYVTVSRNVMQVYKSWRAGSYPRVTLEQAAALGAGRGVRLGTYGDPAAVPIEVWAALVSHADYWTAYTHQWTQPFAQPLKAYAMASVDSEEEAREAWALGWRTFRVMPAADDLRAAQSLLVPGREIVCPASEEAGKRTTCEVCRACYGDPGSVGPYSFEGGPRKELHLVGRGIRAPEDPRSKAPPLSVAIPAHGASRAYFEPSGAARAAAKHSRTFRELDQITRYALGRKARLPGYLHRLAAKLARQGANPKAVAHELVSSLKLKAPGDQEIMAEYGSDAREAINQGTTLRAILGLGR